MYTNNSDWVLKHPGPNDIAKVKEFLALVDLPTERIEDQFDKFLILFDADSSIIGIAGLEVYQNYGLVRSVAIVPEFQNKNIGSFLVQKLEQQAKDLDVSELYLLTETAQNFFSKQGYTVVQRIFVPSAIQNTSEYASSCKESALVMKKTF